MEPCKRISPIMKSADLKLLFTSPHHTMLEVMQRINETAQGISLVLDSDGRLVDTVTDGDLRRAVLAGTDLRRPVSELRAEPHRPFTLPASTPRAELARMLREIKLRHIPLVDDSGQVVDMV